MISRDVKIMEENLFTKKNDEIEDKNEMFKEIEVDLLNKTENNNEEKNEDKTEKRLPGRPSLIRTRKPGRPRKVYRSTIKSTLEENDAIRMVPEDLENDVFTDAEANYATIEYHDALSSKHSEDWNKAIYQEMKQLVKNDTWNIVDEPERENIIDSKLILTNKVDENGNIKARKARLVARGFAQVYGVDYFQTFAPVVRLESLRILIALAVHFDLKIDQIDVNSAYLNGELNEDVYMRLPDSIENYLNDMIQYEKDENIKHKARCMLDLIKKGIKSVY